MTVSKIAPSVLPQLGLLTIAATAEIPVICPMEMFVDEVQPPLGAVAVTAKLPGATTSKVGSVEPFCHKKVAPGIGLVAVNVTVGN